MKIRTKNILDALVNLIFTYNEDDWKASQLTAILFFTIFLIKLQPQKLYSYRNYSYKDQNDRMDSKTKQLKKRPKNIVQVIVKQQDGEAGSENRPEDTCFGGENYP